MVLQALARYYDILVDAPGSPVAPFGYSAAGASFALELSPEGELLGITRLFQTVPKGKKTADVPLTIQVPERAIRTVGIVANFLCDNSAYVLGISERDETDPSYAARRFQCFRELHQKILAGVDCPEARAVLAFLAAHDPKQARQNPLIAEKLPDLLGGNIVFRLLGEPGYAHTVAAIRKAWEAYKAASGSELLGQCLVSGEQTPIARLHPAIKGIRGANATGASLVGFNAPAYESYNRAKGQGLNAPTGEKAAFAYGTALNYLLSRESGLPRLILGETTVVYWAESPNQGYADLLSTLLDPAWAESEDFTRLRDPTAELRLKEIAQKIKTGEPVDEEHLMAGIAPGTQFYVLGLGPNVARLVVRFFHRDLFINIVRRIMAHYEDMAIQREFESQPARLSPWAILQETFSKRSKDKEPAPLLPAALMRAILEGTPYPAALYYAILNRVRADQDDSKAGIRKINYVRAAVIKAYLARKYRRQPDSRIQEVVSMTGLNEESTHPAYLLGRLFAVLEKAQTEAVGDVNATIKDRYFTSACASPATVFPVLLRLAQHHLAKAEYGYVNDRRIQEIMNCLEMNEHPIPQRLTLDEQGVFVLGYYHQRAAFYQPKPGKDTGEPDETK